MRRFMAGAVFAVAALVLWASHDGAQSVGTVRPGVIDHWLDLAQQIRNLGFCGYDPKDPALSLDRNVQTRFAHDVNEDTINTRTGELEGTLARCSFCTTYARTAVAASADNILYGCGFTGPLWNTNQAYHFNGCMSVDHCVVTGAGVAALAGIADCSTFEELERDYLNPDTGERTQDIAQCKLTHTRRDCASCHQSQSSAAVQSMPASRSSVRDTLKRLTPAAKTSNSSGNDLAKPSDASRRRAAAPKGSSTGAMDRLSGDGQSPNSSRDSSTPGGGNRPAPASGGASAGTGPVTNTPAPSMSMDRPTRDFSIGRPSAPPR